VKKQRLGEEEACRFFHQIITGIELVHAKGVAHRDLKPENLLLDDSHNIKIVDFGLSNTFKPGQFLKTACGSPCYAAPEMISGQEYDPQQSDVWSIGVILYAMIVGHLPFEDSNTSQLYRKITSGHFQIPSFVSESAKMLLGGILQTDPKKRMSVSDIKRSRWYQGLIHTDRLTDRPRSLQFVTGHGCEVPLCTMCKSWSDTGHIDEQVIAEMTNLEFPLDYVIKCLKLNKHNHATTTYHLLSAKRTREGYLSSRQSSRKSFVNEPVRDRHEVRSNRPVSARAIPTSARFETQLSDDQRSVAPEPAVTLRNTDKLTTVSYTEFSIATPVTHEPAKRTPIVGSTSARNSFSLVDRLPFSARTHATPSPVLHIRSVNLSKSSDRPRTAVHPPRYSTARSISPEISRLSSRLSSSVFHQRRVPSRLSPSLNITESSVARSTASTRAKTKPSGPDRAKVAFGSTTGRFGVSDPLRKNIPINTKCRIPAPTVREYGTIVSARVPVRPVTVRTSRASPLPLSSRRPSSSRAPPITPNYGGLSARLGYPYGRPVLDAPYPRVRQK
jgi:serine/threonine protein kinase